MTHTYTVFGGLYGPLDPMPALNEANAGRALPVGFEMGADYGDDPVVPGSQPIDCETHAAVGPLESAGRGHLNASASGRYTYVWKTDKAWAGTCRSLILSFDAPGWSSDVVFFASFD